MLFETTRSKIPRHTASRVNKEIQRQTEVNIAHFGSAGPKAIDERLAQLDREWDIERYLETMAPAFTLLGITLGLTKDRRWMALSAVVQSFFLQHALYGWCPPVPVLRRLGVRTAAEIDEERYALKARRGDFRDVGPEGNVFDAIRAVQR